MKFIIEPPQKMDSGEASIVDGNMEIVPSFVKGQKVIRAFYLTAVGDGGVESKVTILFNGNTGDFSIQKNSGDPPKLMFDLPKVEFDKRRNRARTMNRSKGLRRQTADEEPVVDETVSEQVTDNVGESTDVTAD